MRTTVTLDDEVSAAVERIKRERGGGVSAAINELARRGLAAEREDRGRAPFEQETSAMGVEIDVSNVAEALERLEN